MLDIFEHAAIEAGKAILDVYRAGPDVAYKADASPVTEADERAEAIILAALHAAFPDIPVVAEESVAAGRIPQGDLDHGTFILVDPLDGTKEFIHKRDDFTVNIALVRSGVPVAGIVYAPAKGVAYIGAEGRAEKLAIEDDYSVSSCTAIACRRPGKALTAVASRSHNGPETEAFLRERGISDMTSVGSSLKFCLLAEGAADVYPRFGRTMEWDTAAGDAVLRAAGGITVTLDGKPFAYGKRHQSNDSDFANPFFIAWASRAPIPAEAG